MASAMIRPLPPDTLFPPLASDWLTRFTSPNVTFREGKWWDRYHYEMWKRDLVSDQLRRARNLALIAYLDSQPVGWK